MSKRNEKKIVFVIVEGPSDQMALELLLNKIFIDEQVRVKVVYTDITTEFIGRSENIVTKVNELVRSYRNANRLTSGDFKEIIHIVDTDGAFISDDSVVEDLSAQDPVYTPKEIRTNKKSGIEARNQRKRNNLGKLVWTKKIGGIPYRVFYMSCNLDHVLHNKQMSSDKEKSDDAFRFAQKYKDNLPGFIDFISNSNFSVQKSYKESWEFIKEGTNSLNRYTNLAICFSSQESDE